MSLVILHGKQIYYSMLAVVVYREKQWQYIESRSITLCQQWQYIENRSTTPCQQWQYIENRSTTSCQQYQYIENRSTTPCWQCQYTENRSTTPCQQWQYKLCYEFLKARLKYIRRKPCDELCHSDYLLVECHSVLLLIPQTYYLQNLLMCIF